MPDLSGNAVTFQDFERVVRGIANRLHVLETQEHSHRIVNTNAVPLQSPWAPYGGTAPVVWMLHTTGRVFIEGLIHRTSGLHTSNEPLALLPVGARPRIALIFNQRVAGGNWRIDANPSGTLNIVDDGGAGSPETYISLTGISYLV